MRISVSMFTGTGAAHQETAPALIHAKVGPVTTGEAIVELLLCVIPGVFLCLIHLAYEKRN
jgi:energy-converting hydrogenase Eha subunit E